MYLKKWLKLNTDKALLLDIKSSSTACDRALY